MLVLLLLSGMAGLMYQVLWMKQLGLLFGNTAAAASTTLAAFFAGLAVGSWYFGTHANRWSRPLRLYAMLEAGIAITALVYFGLLELFYAMYPWFHHTIPGDAGSLVLKLIMALLLIFPPAFFMGGTLPALGQHLIRSRQVFGKTASLLYGVNTFGAAAGVIVAVFVFVPAMGFRLTYSLAMFISLGVALVSWVLSRQGEPLPVSSPAPDTTAPRDDEASSKHGLGPLAIHVLCFLSGFCVLALEVLWTRMFAQIHSNSVYAFAVMLGVVLTGLAIGAWLASGLARTKLPASATLGLLMTLGGVALLLGPKMFMLATNDMQPMSALEGWLPHVARMFGIGVGGVGLVVVVLGMVFPFIMKVEERYAAEPGRALGGLLASNTAGSILGAVVCGFVMLPMLGMWGTLRVIAVLYLLAVFAVVRGWRPEANACRLVAGLSLVLLFTVLDPTRLPTAVPPVSTSGTSRVVETFEGSDGTVAVVENDRGAIAITYNSGYTLGSTAAYQDQIQQSTIPLYIFPETKSIFYLGLGTGISAGAALSPEFPNVERIVATELVPQVITAARKYITDHRGRDLTNGLFTDPRVTILAEDGRHYLRVTDQTYDMINADLFLPYRRGAGSLYSLDHYLTARTRLNPGGVYVQWLPMFQITESEFGIIAATMLQAFDQVTMWRNNFTPGREIVALIGQKEPASIPASPYSTRLQMLQAVMGLRLATTTPDMPAPEAPSITFFYAGNLSVARELFENDPINTDDKPLIEYQTPRTFRENLDEQVIWFVGPRLDGLIERIFEQSPIESDPALAKRSQANRKLALSGMAFHRAMVNKALGREAESRVAWERFLSLWRAGAD